MDGSATNEVDQSQRDENFSAADAKARFKAGVKKTSGASNPPAVKPIDTQQEEIENVDTEEFDIAAVRESFELTDILDADAKTTEINNSRREVVGKFLRSDINELKDDSGVDQYGQSLEQIEARYDILQKELLPQFEELRGKAIEALVASGIRDPEKILSLYELQRFAANEYYFSGTKSLNPESGSRLKDGLKELYRDITSTRDSWDREHNNTAKGDQLIGQFRILDQTPEILSRENLKRLIDLTAGHIDDYSLDFTISSLNQLSQIPQDRFDTVLQLVKGEYTFLWPGNLMDEESNQKIQFVTQLMQRPDLKPEELQTLGTIQSSSKIVNDIFEDHPLIKSMTPDEIFANSARFEDELAVLEQVIFELKPQNPRYGKEDDIRSFLYYFQRFSGNKVFGRLNILAEKKALHPLVKALNSGWQLGHHVNDFNPEKSANLDRFIQDITNAQPVESIQQNGDLETIELTSFLREVYKANKGGVENSYQIEHITEMLDPRYRETLKQLIRLANTVGDDSSQKRDLLQKFCSDFNSREGFSFEEVSRILTSNIVNEKFSGDEREFWLILKKVGGDYGHRNKYVQNFLFQNRSKFPDYVSAQENYGKTGTRFTPQFLKDSLPYMRALFDEMPKNQNSERNELEIKREFFDVFLNQWICPTSLYRLALSYGDSRNRMYQHEVEVGNEIITYLSSNIDAFFQDNNPQWSMALTHFAEKSPGVARRLLASYGSESEVLKSIPEPERLYWKEFSRVSESLYPVIVRNISGRDEEAIKKVGIIASMSDAFEQFPENVRPLRDSILAQIINEGTATEEIQRNLSAFVDIYQRLQQSPSKEIRKFQDQIILQIVTNPDPIGAYEKIESVFVLNNLPEVGKIYRVFEILHPPGKIEEKVGDRKANRKNGQAQLSPTLMEAGRLRKYDIIYRDLLKVHIDSANPSLYRYLKALKDGQVLVDKAESQGYESLDISTEVPQLTRFLNRMDTIYSNSLYGRRNQQSFDRNRTLQERVDDLRRSFSLKAGESMTERVATMFGKPLGYTSIDQVIDRMEQVRVFADRRNREYFEDAVANNEGKLRIKEGDLLKGVQSEYLEVFFQNGSVAKEYLGAGASSDTTPFDTDVSIVLPADFDGRYRNIFDSSLVGSYGDLVFVFKDRGQFQRTNAGEASYDKDKYELFDSNYHGSRHFGIRTGIAATEIDAIVVQNNLENDQAGQERLFFDIAQSGFYMPVSDKDGAILFTPDDFENYRLKNDQVYGLLEEPSFQPTSLIELYKKSPYLQRLYDSDVGVSEGYTLGQHTEMMMGQFEKYFSNTWSSPLIDRNKMRIALSVHDLGKPLSVQITGSTREQHEYTLKFVPQVFEGFGFNQKEAEIATAIIDQDYLGEFVKGQVSAEETARHIQNKAIELGVPIKDFTELLRIYYMSDASSYTVDAGGQFSLDRLFVFVNEDGVNEIHFAPDTQEKFNQLTQFIYQS